MYNYKIKIRIHNPEVEREVEVPQFSSLDECIEKYGKTTILAIVNDHLISLARSNTRNQMIDEVTKGIKK